MSTLLGPSGQAISTQPASATSPGGQDGSVKDVTSASFVVDVIEGSRDKVVLVDFWAPWCGPCKQLAPALEKAVSAFAGSVSLVKMNIDEYPDIAGQLGIRSIPAVIAFRQGQPLDGFVGAQSESQIKAFLERVAGPPTDGVAEVLAAADAARAAQDHHNAALLYQDAMQRDPGNPAAIAGLGLVSVDAGDLEGANAILEQLPPEYRAKPEIQGFEAALKLAEQASSLGGAAALKLQVEQSPDDHQARLDLAVALAGENDRLGAVGALIELMRRDREWNDGAAQKELIKFFEAWGPADPATIAGRRKMASILFA